MRALWPGACRSWRCLSCHRTAPQCPAQEVLYLFVLTRSRPRASRRCPRLACTLLLTCLDVLCRSDRLRHGCSDRVGAGHSHALLGTER